MTNKISKNIIWGVYAVLTVILGSIGYFIGKNHGTNYAKLYSIVGVVIGVTISIILWTSWGKKNSY